MIHEPVTRQDCIWQCLTFEQLDTRTLYDVLALRAAVFVVEQNCPYQDADGLDDQAWHLLGYRAGELVGVARLLPPGVAGERPAIGRVVTRANARGQGLGRELMGEAVSALAVLFPGSGMALGAQAHLVHFYQAFGFVPVGAVYLEDGIEHQWMQRAPD
ncbi:GNAT family N-acetyltransferase [Saccharospirillum impatiens]|uniref:GNAT family N-acetyltransferase n=1 Tax=Saccharospirillum impatiens TaxID=169438 RepID=UPI0003FF6823|nr:GNAT family N-acetyltransferase [Saccharospirillum impatiens]